MTFNLVSMISSWFIQTLNWGMLARTLCTQDTTNTLHVKYLSPFEEWRPRHISPTNGTSGDMCAMMGTLFCDVFYVLKCT